MLHARRYVRLDESTAAPWRNGGGVTRELLRWPNSADWRLRISVADIASEGPFSAFAGVQRCLALLSGEGVELDFAGQRQVLRPGDAPHVFDGAAAPGCRLLGGPVRDLNLMYRDGHGGMTAVASGVSWCAPAGAQAGLFARVPGCWYGDGIATPLSAQSLLWFEAPPVGDSRFETDLTSAEGHGPVGWWLHYLPLVNSP